MQILKKKHKSHKILELFLGFCCLFTLLGCAIDNEKELSSQENNKPTITNDFPNVKVKTKNKTDIYVNDGVGLIKKGIVEANVYLDIDDREALQDTLPIKGTNWYVKQSDVISDGSTFKNQTHLIPYDLELITKDNYIIEDINGRQLITCLKSDRYQIYVKSSAQDQRYGVVLQNKVYYISENDVQNVEERVIDQTGQLATSVPVMMYHFFYDESLNERAIDSNYVEVEEFKAQLDYLVNNGYTSLTMSEVLHFVENRAQVPINSYAITIDDGHESVYKYAYPIMKEHHINATLFLITGWMNPVIPYEYIEMRENGIELQSHGFLMHQGGCNGMGHGGRLQCVDYEEGVEDTIRSFEYVDHGFAYCYPFGDVNDHAVEILKESKTKLAFTTDLGKVQPGMDVFRLPRIRVKGKAGIEEYIRHLN